MSKIKLYTPWRHGSHGCIRDHNNRMVLVVYGWHPDCEPDQRQEDMVKVALALPAMLDSLKAITDCYGVGYKTADEFVKAVHPLMMEAREILANIP